MFFSVWLKMTANWQLSDADFLKAFSLATKGDGILKERHPFPRENRITFNEVKHEYTIDGKVAPRSVTKLLKEYASEFEPERALIAMKNGRDWPEKKRKLENQHIATGDADFLKRWEFNGEVARSRGTLLHYHCELMMNGIDVDKPHSPEFGQGVLTSFF